MAIVAVALLGLVMFWAGAPPAQAGGPTSVLLANSATGQVAAFGYDDSGYAGLAAALGVFDEEPTTPTTPSDADDFAQQIRLTWLIHDTRVWRVDILHSGPDGDWLIETRVPTESGDVWGGKPTWHRAKDPKALRTLITRAGLLESAVSRGPADDPEDVPAAGATSTPASTVAVVGTGGTGRNLAVGLGAGLLGLFGGGLGVGWFLRDRRQRPGPDKAENKERVTLIG